MKKSLLAAGVALMASHSAFALNPATDPTPDAVIYAGGGSAQAQVMFWLADKLFTNADVISTAATCAGDDPNYRVIYGNLRTTAGSLAANSKVLLIYKFNGGSFLNGIQSNGTGATLPYPLINATTMGSSSTTGCTGATLSTSSANVKPKYRITAALTDPKVPDWGLADEEPGLLNTPVNTNTILSAGQVNNIDSAGLYVNVFGVAASENVTSPSTVNGSCAKTSISRSEMNGIITGFITDWSQLEGDGGCAIASGPINFLDRGKGSGSKAAGNEFFLENPSSPSHAVGPTAPSGTLCSGYSVTAQGSNSAIVAALNANGDVAQTCRMIGVLGGEFPPAKNAPSNYQYLKIDGVDAGLNQPTGTNITYTNVINGKYEFVYTNSFNNRTATVGANPQHHVNDGTPFAVLISRVKTLLRDPTLPAGASPTNLLSPSGVLLDPNVAADIDACVMRTTRYGNSRAPMQPFYTFDTAPNAGCSDLN